MSTKITAERIKSLKEFSKPLGLDFKRWDLLDLAFHHCSYSNENPGSRLFNNERLEFLGDSVLGLATANYLYKMFAENHQEGELAKIKAAVVSEKALAPVALKFGIDRMLVLGKGEEQCGGRTKPAILADCMEAVIGAYFLDSGYEKCEKYVLSFIKKEVDSVLETGGKDYKSLLQEVFQKKHKMPPEYELKGVTGPDHAQTFSVVVHLGNVTYGPATGKSKKEAEQNVAKYAYNCLKSE